MAEISQRERENLEVMKWDSLYEGEENPIIRIYYWLRLKGAEIKCKQN